MNTKNKINSSIEWCANLVQEDLLQSGESPKVAIKAANHYRRNMYNLSEDTVNIDGYLNLCGKLFTQMYKDRTWTNRLDALPGDPIWVRALKAVSLSAFILTPFLFFMALVMKMINP